VRGIKYVVVTVSLAAAAIVLSNERAQLTLFEPDGVMSDGTVSMRLRSGEPRNDVLGIKLGMPTESAVKILEDHDFVRFERTVPQKIRTICGVENDDLTLTEYSFVEEGWPRSSVCVLAREGTVRAISWHFGSLSP
jgi:hypothetical protein